MPVDHRRSSLGVGRVSVVSVAVVVAVAVVVVVVAPTHVVAQTTPMRDCLRRDLYLSSPTCQSGLQDDRRAYVPLSTTACDITGSTSLQFNETLQSMFQFLYTSRTCDASTLLPNFAELKNQRCVAQQSDNHLYGSSNWTFYNISGTVHAVGSAYVDDACTTPIVAPHEFGQYETLKCFEVGALYTNALVGGVEYYRTELWWGGCLDRAVHAPVHVVDVRLGECVDYPAAGNGYKAVYTAVPNAECASSPSSSSSSSAAVASAAPALVSWASSLLALLWLA